MRNWTIAIRTALSIGLIALLAWAALTPRARTTAEAAVITPNNVEFIDALVRAGLAPEQLTAAGFNTADVENSLSDAWAHLVEHEDDLENADAALRTAAEEFHALERLIRTRQATEQQQTDFAQAEAAYAAALAQRQAVIDAIYAAGTADLSEDPKVQTLSAIRQNQPWRTPWEFMVINREESGWVNLREALAAERYALKYEEEVDPSAAALLAQEREIAAVAAAMDSLANNLDDITGAWNNAVAPQ